MTTTSWPFARVLPGVVLAVTLGGSLAGCGSSSGAVESSQSLDRLGAQLAKDGEMSRLFLAGTAAGAEETVTEDATEDVSCPGGKRRSYRASFTASSAVAGGDGTAEDVRNAEGLAAQTAFSRAGYDLVTDVDKSSSELPATLDFANDPKSPDQARTFRTTVKVDGDEFTTTITGTTACIAD